MLSIKCGKYFLFTLNDGFSKCGTSTAPGNERANFLKDSKLIKMTSVYNRNLQFWNRRLTLNYFSKRA